MKFVNLEEIRLKRVIAELKKIVSIVKKHCGLIATITLFSVVITLVINLFIMPTYGNEMKLVVKPGIVGSLAKELSAGSLFSNKTLMLVYTEIVEGKEQGLKIMIGILVGMTLGLGGAFYQEYAQRTINTVKEAQQYLGLPVLGSIPEFGDDTSSTVAYSRLNRIKKNVRDKGEVFL